MLRDEGEREPPLHTYTVWMVLLPSLYPEGGSRGRAGARLAPSSSVSAAAASFYSSSCSSGQSLWKKGRAEGQTAAGRLRAAHPGSEHSRGKTTISQPWLPPTPSLLARFPAPCLEEGAPSPAKCLKGKCSSNFTATAHHFLPQIFELRSGDCFWEARSFSQSTNFIEKPILVSPELGSVCYTN